MAYELEGRPLFPLSSLIELADFPLGDFLPVSQIQQVFQGLYYTEAASRFDGENLVFDLQIAFADVLGFGVPGTSVFTLGIGDANQWNSFRARLTLGPDFSLSLYDLELSLTFSESVLQAKAGGPVSLKFPCDLRFSPRGFELLRAPGLQLEPAYVGGTKILIEAQDLLPVFGDSYVLASGDGFFQGVAFNLLKVTLPEEYLTQKDAAGNASPIVFLLENATIGTTGFTGKVSVLPEDLDNALQGEVLGHTFRFRQFTLDIEQNALVDISLGVDVHLDAFDWKDANGDLQEKWIGVDFQFGADGSFVGALSAVQPTPKPGEEPDPQAEALVTLQYDGVLRFHVGGIRIARESSGLWWLYFSGVAQFLFPGSTQWPTVRFKEIGINSEKQLILPEGGGIVFDSPLVVKWELAELTVSKLRLGTAPAAQGQAPDPNKLQLGLSAEVNLVKGLPSGVAVDGLTVSWTLGSSAPPDVSVAGIRIHLSVPGSFSASFEASSFRETQADGTHVVEFRGGGHVELSPLQMRVDIGVVVGRQGGGDPFNYLYFFADAKLVPSGIPIGQTGVAIYGFQGLIAYNMELLLDRNLPEPYRYEELFFRDNKIGLAHQSKWGRKKGQHALGFGVVLGTVDTGFTLNVKGLLLVAFPDLTIFLQARANLVRPRPGLDSKDTGALDALLVYAAGSSSLSLALKGSYDIPKTLSVVAPAQAYFAFNDPSAWFLQMGEDIDGRRVAAKAVEWSGSWLFNAGFWLRLDQGGPNNALRVATGAVIQLDLEAEVKPFYFAVHGYARGGMALTWRPDQFEGTVELRGRVEAGIKDIAAVGVELAGTAEAFAPNPLKVELWVRACFSLGIGPFKKEFCPEHTFRWRYESPPPVEFPFLRCAAKPRHWTPLDVLRTGEALDTGTVEVFERLSGSAPPPLSSPRVIPPNSVLHLHFAHSMVDEVKKEDGTPRFNESLNGVPNGGWLKIGANSAYAVRYRLADMRLYEVTPQGRVVVPFFGTWAQETPIPQQKLALMSSGRFWHDGSSTAQKWVESMDLDYCETVINDKICVSLKGTGEGFGVLEDGTLYHLGSDGALALIPPGRPPSATVRISGPDPRLVYVVPDPSNPPRYVVPAGTLGLGEQYEEFCYEPGFGPEQWRPLKKRGGKVHVQEKWDVPVEQQLFVPGRTYELDVMTAIELKQHDILLTSLGKSETATVRFIAGAPPSRADELQNYVQRVYPSDGMRPVYTDYDLVVRFHDDYIAYLFEAAQKELSFRLFDGQGEPIRDASGNALLLPATTLATGKRQSTEERWVNIYNENVTRGCVSGPPIPDPQDTEASLAHPKLTPNSQYRAEIVSHNFGQPATGPALFSWTFTTSRFKTFTDLVTQSRSFGAVLRATSVITSTQPFEDLMRVLGLPTTHYVDWFRVTPIHNSGNTSLIACLLESPEPLGFGGRLLVEVTHPFATILGKPVVNVDDTRALIFIEPNGARKGADVRLTWRRRVLPAQENLPPLSISGDSSDEVVSFSLPVE